MISFLLKTINQFTRGKWDHFKFLEKLELAMHFCWPFFQKPTEAYFGAGKSEPTMGGTMHIGGRLVRGGPVGVTRTLEVSKFFPDNGKIAILSSVLIFK